MCLSDRELILVSLSVLWSSTLELYDQVPVRNIVSKNA